MDDFSIAYLSGAAIVVSLYLATLIFSLWGIIKNRLSLWSPHMELFFYVFGNMFTTASFVFRWVGDMEHTQAPLFIVGYMFTISALLILNNRMQYLLDSTQQQLLPFWVCSFSMQKKTACLLQFIFSQLPYLVCFTIDLVLLLVNTSVNMLYFTNDTVFTLLIYYHCTLLLISANRYIKMNSGLTRYSKLQYTISILTFADALVGQGFFWGLSVVYMFNLQYDEDLVEEYVYVKDWISLVIYFLANVLVFLSLKDVFMIKKRMHEDVDLECLLD